MVIRAEINRQQNISNTSYFLELFESVPELIARQAKQIPDKIAIIFNNQSLTYFELNSKINHMAAYIIQYVKHPETLIGIALDRSLDLIISLIACLKVGAVYIPLDPNHPQQRLQFILNDIKPDLLITSSDLRNRFKNITCNQISYDEIKEVPSCLRIGQKAPTLYPHQLAYILYTSGSTGQPKGVMISHFSLVNFLKSLISSLPLQRTDRFLSVTAPTFDISGLEYFGTLLAGSTLILASQEIVSQGSRLLELLYKQNPTIMQATPITWQMLLEAGWQPAEGLKVLCGGESLSFNLFKQLLHSNVQLWNLYGPTETTIWSTYAKYTQKDHEQEIHIGNPIAHTQIELMHDDMQDSGRGELCIAGVGVARGYWNRPDLTAEKFTPNSFISNWQQSSLYGRLYHTGDRATKLENGAFKCLGRIDHQVKVRGHRIEVEEIESILNKQAKINQAIVKAESTPQGYNKLVAYIIHKVKSGDGKILIAEIKEFLADKLPDYMIPQSYRFLEKFPLTANGKVDRKALHADDRLLPANLTDFGVNSGIPSARDCDGVNKKCHQNHDSNGEESSLSALECLLTKIYAEELHIKDIGLEDDLLGLGLDSLSCLKIAMKLKSHHLFVKERTILSCSSIKQLAQSIENQANPISKTLPKISKTGLKEAFASLAQQRLWLMDQLLPVKGLYHVAHAFRIKGHFNEVKFQNALKLLIIRHEILRTIFLEKRGEIYQQILDIEDVPFSIKIGSTEKLPDGLSIEQFLIAQTQQPFILSIAPLFRTYVLQVNAEEWIISFVMHHILMDEWSIEHFFKDIQLLYEDKHSLPPLPIQNIDFSVWHRALATSGHWKTQSEFWQKQLQHVIQEPLLQADRKRKGYSGYHTVQYTQIIPPSQLACLHAFTEQAKVTLFMTLTAILHLFLYRYSHRTSIVTGAPIANRHYPDVEKLLSCLVNIVALESKLNDHMSFEDLLSQIKHTVLDAYENQDIPFETVVNDLNIKHSLGVHPLFQVVLILQNQNHPFTLDGLNVEEIRLETAFSNPSPFDLTLWAKETIEGLELRFEYAKELFDKKTIQHFSSCIENLIASVLENPKEKISLLPLFSPSRLIEAIHRGELYPYDPQEGVIERLEKYAASSHSKVSIIFKGQSLTYGMLFNHVNHLANHLISFGIQLEDPICLLGERNIEFLISILAILKVGAAYIPIDPKLPKDRIQIILSSCHPRIILTNSDFKMLCEELASPICLTKVIDDLLYSPVGCKSLIKKNVYLSIV